MTSRTFIGVDPGSSGGIAWSNRSGVFVVAMPETRRGCIDTIDTILQQSKQDGCSIDPIAYMEKVAPFIPGGGASSMFIFGRNVERVGCVLECKGVRIVEIIPRSWQKALGLGNSDRVKITKDMSPTEVKSAKAHNDIAKRQWKSKLKEEAERRFPKIKVTLKNCDALLLLDVAIQTERAGLGI